MLLHGVSDHSYVRPEVPPVPGSTDGPRVVRGGSLATATPARAASSTALNSASSAATADRERDSPWKPRKHAGSNLFVPRTRLEEAVLLLLLSENMARLE